MRRGLLVAGVPADLLAQKQPQSECAANGQEKQSRQLHSSSHAQKRHPEQPPARLSGVPVPPQAVDAKKNKTNQRNVYVRGFTEPKNQRITKPESGKSQAEQPPSL